MGQELTDCEHRSSPQALIAMCDFLPPPPRRPPLAIAAPPKLRPLAQFGMRLTRDDCPNRSLSNNDGQENFGPKTISQNRVDRIKRTAALGIVVAREWTTWCAILTQGSMTPAVDATERRKAMRCKSYSGSCGKRAKGRGKLRSRCRSRPLRFETLDARWMCAADSGSPAATYPISDDGPACPRWSPSRRR